MQVYATFPPPPRRHHLRHPSGDRQGARDLRHLDPGRNPTIVAGQGSLTSFSATLHKSWSYKGKKQSLLYASCPDGHLAAHGAFDFVEGTSISGNIVKPCSS